jgi:hypothetical protein
VSSGAYLAALRAIDGLYEAVVTDPGDWNDQAFADWANEALIEAAGLSRPALREIRRCVRAAQKLQAFWISEQQVVADHDDWRSRVDIASGPRAWRPTLDLAQLGLAAFPCEELFDEVKARFAVVNSQRWMDGIGFEEWQQNN